MSISMNAILRTMAGKDYLKTFFIDKIFFFSSLFPTTFALPSERMAFVHVPSREIFALSISDDEE